MARKVIEIFGSIYFPKADLASKLNRCLNKAEMDSDYHEIYRFINSYSHNNSIQSLQNFDSTIYTS
jgi:wobble nucleotide-excising tRNase